MWIHKECLSHLIFECVHVLIFFIDFKPPTHCSYLLNMPVVAHLGELVNELTLYSSLNPSPIEIEIRQL